MIPPADPPGVPWRRHALWAGFAVLYAALIFLLTLATDRSVRRLTLVASETASQRAALLAASRRNAEAVRSLGMHGRMGARWAAINRTLDEAQATMLDRSTGFAGASRIFAVDLSGISSAASCSQWAGSSSGK